MDSLRDSALRAQLTYRRERLREAIPDARDSAQLVRLLQEVEAALKRIDGGSYGICEICNDPIEEEHLRADPLVRFCLAHLSEDQQHAIERDLQLASMIQGQLLPTQHARVDGWELCYHYEPFGVVSGDYCDLVKPEKEGGDTFFLFGDVSGKGVAASLLMSQLHAIFRSLIASDLPLTRLVERANRLFSESTASTHFATLVCGRATTTGEIEVCNAGHCPPIVARRGVITSLESTGLPIGMFYSGEYEVSATKLERGDSLVLYTDGVTETRDSSNQEYGEERLSALIGRNYSLSSHDLINTCLQDLSSFRGAAPKTDDLTIMVLKRVE
jgi:sigma-B regulation protein RsbU (phosphoserine phosphatase)